MVFLRTRTRDTAARLWLLATAAALLSVIVVHGVATDERLAPSSSPASTELPVALAAAHLVDVLYSLRAPGIGVSTVVKPPERAALSQLIDRVNALDAPTLRALGAKFGVERVVAAATVATEPPPRHAASGDGVSSDDNGDDDHHKEDADPPPPSPWSSFLETDGAAAAATLPSTPQTRAHSRVHGSSNKRRDTASMTTSTTANNDNPLNTVLLEGCPCGPTEFPMMDSMGFAVFWAPTGVATAAVKTIITKNWMAKTGDGTKRVMAIHKTSHTKLGPAPSFKPAPKNYAAERMHQLVTDAAVYDDWTLHAMLHNYQARHTGDEFQPLPHPVTGKLPASAGAKLPASMTMALDPTAYTDDDATTLLKFYDKLEGFGTAGKLRAATDVSPVMQVLEYIGAIEPPTTEHSSVLTVPYGGGKGGDGNGGGSTGARR